MVFTYYNIKHATGISYNPTGQAILERSNWTLKEILNRQKETTKNPRDRLRSTLLTLNFWMLMSKTLRLLKDIRLWKITTEIHQSVYIEDILTSEWKMRKCIVLGTGYTYISTGKKSYGFLLSWLKSAMTKGDFLKTSVMEKKRETNTVNKIGDVSEVMFMSL